ncbi:cell death activator CIDE-A isoform X1 [Budorcas taxicolor]|uniref:cell death activator CIDE-A isoform X1 n=1 Tax=Budorcas taxicolor TaxID=37181 RepID=UPI002284765E|nr:cell death activator CIDE-A isoform X1 [Budorcas taxicolor]
METARDCAGALLRPLTFMGSQTKKVLFTPLMHPARPFRVSNHDRSSRRGVIASSLQELLSKTLDALVVASQLVTLVLEEDGTVVDTEEFFQTLGDNTHLMVLEQGQKWTPLLQEDHVKMLFINLGFQRSLASPNPKGLKRTESWQPHPSPLATSETGHRESHLRLVQAEPQGCHWLPQCEGHHVRDVFRVLRHPLHRVQGHAQEPAAVPVSRCPGDWPVSCPHGYLHAPSAG